MFFNVLALRNYLKIIWMVVSLVAIYVMNDFAR